MYILGISCYYHKSAAAIIKDGQIVAAAAEERFSRVKHDNGFPSQAIAYCLEAAGVAAARVDYVVFYEKPFVKFERNLTISARYAPFCLPFFVESMYNELTEKLWIKSKIAAALSIAPENILFVPHHMSHAAASYFPSPFERAAVLTLDGVGEWTTGAWGVARGNTITLSGEMRFPHSVGLLYSAFTAYLGFRVNDGEYTVMGLAAYGKPKYVHRVKKLYRQFSDGSIRLNLEYFAFHTGARSMYTRTFIDLFARCGRADVAASIQKVTEEIVLAMMNALYARTHEKNLVFGGGVALNSVINGRIARKTPFVRVFIFPAAGDDGGAVGAALYVYHQVLGHARRRPLRDVFLGRGYSKRYIEAFLKKRKITYARLSGPRLVNVVSGYLKEGLVVGWFEGRAEFGPRALGHRSILADPRDARVRDIVNGKIKFREEFRPFAPAVLAEHAGRYYRRPDALMSRYMLATYRVGPGTKRAAPATVHVDGSSRIQTVDRAYSGRYRMLLEAFYKKTRRPILLNTSFNLKGEPIVQTPADAYRTFLASGLDVLVLENMVITK